MSNTSETIKEELEKEFGIMTDYFNHRPGYFKLMAEWIIKHREEYSALQNQELIKVLKSMTSSMSAHPDCTEGSEFADMVSIASKLIEKS